MQHLITYLQTNQIANFRSRLWSWILFLELAREGFNVTGIDLFSHVSMLLIQQLGDIHPSFWPQFELQNR